MSLLSKYGIARRPGLVLLGLLLACLGYVLIRHVDACAGGSDSSGYMNQARLLAQGRIHVPVRALPGLKAGDFSEFLYSPLGFRPDRDTIVPTYPIGLPLLIAAAAAILGWSQAANVVIVLHALAAIVLIYALARAMTIRWRGALVAAVCLGASPLFLFFSLQTMSDTPALTWVCATAWTAWRARERGGWWPLWTGFCFSVAVLIRPTDVLLAPALVIAWWPLWHRRTLLGILGGLPGAAALLIYNQAAYGSAFATGYGEAGTLFQSGVVEQTALHYLYWLPLLFTPAVVCFPLLVLRPTRAACFLLVWAAAYLGFYVCYYHTHEAWWYLRFILPAAPALILGWIWALRPYLQWIPARSLAAALAIAAIVGTYAYVIRRDRLPALSAGKGERTYPLAMDWLRANVPPGSVLLCMQTSGAAFYYTPFTLLRWDEIERKNEPEVAEAAANAGRPIYAALFPFEQKEVLDKRMPGDWRKLAQVRAVTIWQWAGPQR